MIKKLLIAASMLSLYSNVFSQEHVLHPSIDKEACYSWPILKEFDNEGSILTNDGKYIVFQYRSNDFQDTVVVKALSGIFEVKFPSLSMPVITSDSRWFITLLPGDSIVIFDLDKRLTRYIKNIQSFSFAKNGRGQWLVCNSLSGSEKRIIVKNLYSNMEKLYKDVEHTWFNDQGTVLLLKKSSGLTWLNLASGNEELLFAEQNITDLSFDNAGNQIAFLTRSQKKETLLNYFKLGMQSPVIVAHNESSGLPTNFLISDGQISFNKSAGKILFSIKKSEKADKKVDTNIITQAINIWTYKDQELQEGQKAQLQEVKNRNYVAVVDILTHKIIQLENEEIKLELSQLELNDFALLSSRVSNEFYWNNQKNGLFLISLADGRKKQLINTSYPGFFESKLTPDEKYVLWMDGNKRNFFSYEIKTEKLKNISASITEPLVITDQRGRAASFVHTSYPFGQPLWIKENNSYIVYTANDIWQLDPSGVKTAICLTNNYGEHHNTTFRFCTARSNNDDLIPVNKQKFLVWGFNNTNKKNGFWLVALDKKQNPDKLFMDDHAYYFHPISVANVGVVGNPSGFPPLKANNASVYVFRKMSSTQQPNLFFTRDFKSSFPLSSLAPPKVYNWLRAELISWTLPDGSNCDGVLHKPEVFDSTRKYPIIFTYYERHSDFLNVFRYPALSYASLNIPWFVSRDYLVFELDFYYKRGKTAQSVINSIIPAAQKLSTLPYVDTTRMGAQGQSFGGYETNVIATRTNIFKAACEMAGPTNIISEYGSMRPGGYSNQNSADRSQRNLGVFPWEHPEVFIENSPLFHIGKMTTPLLMIHNKNDGAILFSQAIELYLGMRRMNKKVWLLEYDGEGHQLLNKNNRYDYTIRMQQFFDHYLKGLPAPVWMIKGVDVEDKGIKSGLELDSTGAIP